MSATTSAVNDVNPVKAISPDAGRVSDICNRYISISCCAKEEDHSKVKLQKIGNIIGNPFENLTAAKSNDHRRKKEEKWSRVGIKRSLQFDDKDEANIKVKRKEQVVVTDKNKLADKSGKRDNNSFRTKSGDIWSRASC